MVRPPLFSEVCGRRWSFADAEVGRRRYCDRVLCVSVVGVGDLSLYFGRAAVEEFEGDRYAWRLLALDSIGVFAVVFVGAGCGLPLWCLSPVVQLGGVLVVEADKVCLPQSDRVHQE